MAHRRIFKLGKCGLSYIPHRNPPIRLPTVLPTETSSIFIQKYRYSQQTETAVKDDKTKDVKGASTEKNTHEFQTETRMLLDIVAKSLYSDKEVFIRELISNASDAMEKLRYAALVEGQPLDSSLAVKISTDKQNRIFTIKDCGIGMTKEELITNLGTIARSGSKAFLEELKKKGNTEGFETSNIIGQFGVGFYSSFMVATKVEVFTKSYKPGSVGYKWSSDGSGTYDIEEAPEAEQGTEIRVYLKVENREFADENTVREVITKYSNFVGCPILVNDNQVNVIQPLWLKDPKEVEPEQHTSFYRFISRAPDNPRFTLHYKTESPIMIRALLYFPEMKPDLFQFSRDSECGVALYTRKVMILSKAENLLPKWLRFVKGVVDSEDIPLNLSRELLQNSALIAKLRDVLTAKVIKFLQEKLTKDRAAYEKFHNDYGIFLKEGLLTTTNTLEKEEMAKLLLFEFSSTPGVKQTLNDYIKNVKNDERKIYFLDAPSRELAEASPYYESVKKKNIDIILCFERYDEIILSNLREFKNFKLVSLENDIREEDNSSSTADVSLMGDVKHLEDWFKKTLKGKVFSVKTTQRLDTHPCVVTVAEMASARQFMKTQALAISEENKYQILQPRLEINPKHPIIKKLAKLVTSDPKLATLLGQQLFYNSMVQAGLLEDARSVLLNINELLTLALEKYE